MRKLLKFKVSADSLDHLHCSFLFVFCSIWCTGNVLFWEGNFSHWKLRQIFDILSLCSFWSFGLQIVSTFVQHTAPLQLDCASMKNINNIYRTVFQKLHLSMCANREMGRRLLHVFTSRIQLSILSDNWLSPPFFYSNRCLSPCCDSFFHLSIQNQKIDAMGVSPMVCAFALFFPW